MKAFTVTCERRQIHTIENLVRMLHIQCIAFWDLFEHKSSWNNRPDIPQWYRQYVNDSPYLLRKPDQNKSSSYYVFINSFLVSNRAIRTFYERSFEPSEHYNNTKSLPNKHNKKIIKFLAKAFHDEINAITKLMLNLIN